MQKKKNVQFFLGIIFFLSFFFSEKVLAEKEINPNNRCNDIDGQVCKLDDCKNYGMEVATGSYRCDINEVCCVEKVCRGAVGCVEKSACQTRASSGNCDSSAEVCCEVGNAQAVTNSCTGKLDGTYCVSGRGVEGTCYRGFCVVVQKSGSGTKSSGEGWNSSDLGDFGLPEADFESIIVNILDWLLTIVGIVAVIALVISGFQYYFVAVDEKMLETAKKTMKNAIIGLIVALSGFIVIQAVDTMLNAGYFF